MGPNNSFKPTPHRGVNSVPYATLHAVATPPRGGLTQALACITKSPVIHMKKYRLVRQLDEWGCGVACLASALRISYKDARTRLEIRKGRGIDAKRCGLWPGQIRDVLRDAGLVYHKISKAERWPVGTIIFLSEITGCYAPYGHYMLKTPDGWMDPWVNMSKLPRYARFRNRLPNNTSVQVALVPDAG